MSAGDTYWRAFNHEAYWERLAAERACGVATWLAVGYRLGGPWWHLALAIVTGRHRVMRRLAPRKATVRSGTFPHQPVPSIPDCPGRDKVSGLLPQLRRRSQTVAP